MNTQRLTTALAAAAAALVVAGCGADLDQAPSDIGGPGRASQDAPQAPAEVPPGAIDTRPCAPTIEKARAEHRTLCAQ